jgi:hypothetical protein
MCLAVPAVLAGSIPAQWYHPTITAITVCANGAGDPGPSCPAGTYDTQQVVLGPTGTTINLYGAHGATDEHASAFPPGALQGNTDYIFFVASGTFENPDIGVLALSGGAGPAANGQWTMDFAAGYGSYAEGHGTVFLAPVVQGRCPTAADPTQQDQTFDLAYAAAGSVVTDPTAAPGSLLMVYEGVNTCIGSTGGAGKTGAYITVGVATSTDSGRTWPSYRSTSTFTFVPLPHANKTQGPNAPFGAAGADVCMGIDCTATPLASYGRYAVISPPLSLASLMAAGVAPADPPNDSEIAAFVDDASPGPARFLYEIHVYGPGSDSPAAEQLPDGRTSDLTVARARLVGGATSLHFRKWDGQGFSEPGIGGHETQILPDGSFTSCGALSQHRAQASISYVDDTDQYLLTFVCSSRGDPASGVQGGGMGSAWFWATSDDLADQTGWSTPREIGGTWMNWDTGTPPGSYGCPSYQGNYPTFMSLGHSPGHLGTTGYAFYMWGCLGGSDANPPKRQYSSRQFVISTASVVRRHLGH